MHGSFRAGHGLIKELDMWPDLNLRPLRPEAKPQRSLPRLRMPDLGSAVHQRPLASVAGTGDSYSLGYSPAAGAQRSQSGICPGTGTARRALAQTSLIVRMCR
jgi:hypothetical protein